MNSTQLVPVLTHCPSPASLWGASWPLAPDPASSDLTAAVCVGQWVHSSHGAVCRKDLPYVSVKAYFWGGREGGREGEEKETKSERKKKSVSMERGKKKGGKQKKRGGERIKTERDL